MVLLKTMDPDTNFVSERKPKDDAMVLDSPLDEAIEKLRLETVKNPDNLKKWDIFLDKLDDKFNQLYSEDPQSIDDAFKQLVYRSYERLVAKYPYLTKYWKNWQLFEYKLNGVEKSIHVLSLSVEAFPTSIELWVDYLSALISQIKSEEEEKRLQIEFIRANYKQAIQYNGYNYNSQLLWDKILEFEASLDPASSVLLQLYLRLITIPLYLYAQYFKQFSEINKNFDITELMSPEQLNEYVVKFNKSTAEELSLIERHQIIDDFCYKINTVTQQQVLQKWNFESSITMHEFSLNSKVDEYLSWVSYLDSEIASFFEHGSPLDAVTNLFERALIPYCYKEKLWLKYLAFVHKLNPADAFEKSKAIFQRAIKILPIADTQVRFSYSKFLLKHEHYDDCLEFLLEIISVFNDKNVYLKQPYLDSIQLFVNILLQIVNIEILQKLLEKIIDSYFDKKNKGNTSIIEGIISADDKILFKANLIDVFSHLLNNSSISIIIVSYLSIILNSKGDSEIKIRKLYNRLSHENALKSSVAFWKFYVEYEGIINRNLFNLQQVMTKIKTATQLPQIIIDQFIDLNYDIVSANLSEAFQVSLPCVESFVQKDNDKSTSLLHNSSLKRRLANNSYYKDAKSHNPGHNKDDEVLKSTRKYAAHPGIFIDTTPDITNQLATQGISLTDNNLSVPPFPTFKNVEKASLPINYPKE